MTARASSSITIDRPIDDVFAALTDVENTERWFPIDVREWWTSEAPHGVGSTRRARVRIGWLRTENDAVVTVYEPPSRAGMKGTSKNAPFEVTLDFDPVGSATRVRASIKLFLSGPARLVEQPFIRWYGRNWDRGLVRLKELMESGRL
jgi:carbon monoxide dehydrogenase subunit G